MPKDPKIVLITGMPGSGKSTLVQKIVGELDIPVGGISTPEIRKGVARTGFAVADLRTGRQGTLASIDIKTKPRVGKYGIGMKDLDEIGAGAVLDAAADPEIGLIVIDELGAMEIKSEKFRMAVDNAFASKKNMLVVLHRNLVDKYRGKGKLFTLTRENRGEILEAVLKILK